MKILKYLLIIIGVLLILFFAMGLTTPSVSYGHEIIVDKPAKETWAISQDPAKFDQWLEGFKSIQLIEGKQDEVGSKYKVVVDPGDGQDEFEMIQTLVAHQPYEYAELHFASDFMDFEQIYRHTTLKDGKTSVKTESKVMAKNLFMKSMFAVMEKLGSSFTTQEAKNMEALKKVIQENTTDYYPEPVEAEAEAMSESEEVGG